MLLTKLFSKIKRGNKYKFNVGKRHNTTKILYVSDLHIDVKERVPDLQSDADILCLCGDIGLPTHNNFKILLNNISKQYKKIFIVAGNHDYGCTALYDEQRVAYYKPKLIDLCGKFDNVYLLDNSFYDINENTIIAGTTLWTNLENVLNIKTYNVDIDIHNKYLKHSHEFDKSINFIENILKSNKKIIMMTHYVPSFKLIEPYYLSKGIFINDFFTTNIEHNIKPPIIAWICGHTHSILSTNINGIYCGVNAIGYKSRKVQHKFIYIE